MINKSANRKRGAVMNARKKEWAQKEGIIHLRSLIRASNISPSFSTYILSLLLRASRIWGSTSGVWAAISVLSASGKLRPLRSVVKGDADCASMLSMDVEVSIKDGGDNGEVILGKVELVVRGTDSWLIASWDEEG